jgi:hypothetical protein
MIISPASTNGALKNGTTVDPAWTTAGCTQGTGNLIVRLTTTNPVLCLSQQSGPISLAPGAKVIVYFKIPQNLLTSVDAGSASSVATYAGNVGSPVSVTVAAK